MTQIFTTPIPFFDFTLYQILIMFVFWSFVGWAVEVVVMTFETGEYQNRGFLNMPICPIYGAGVLLVVTIFRPIADTVLPLFALTALLCTTFELCVGLLMEKIFHNRWWDYSMYKFNFKGYICLWTSCGWGIGCVLVVKFVQPFIEMVISKIPMTGGYIFIGVCFVLIMIDLAASIRAAVTLNSKLRMIDEIGGKMLKPAQAIGGKLAGAAQKVMTTAEKAKGTAGTIAGDIKETVHDKTVSVREDFDERLNALFDKRDKAVLRLVKAFPTMRSLRYPEALERLRKARNIKSIQTQMSTQMSEVRGQRSEQRSEVRSQKSDYSEEDS
ncbi:MAG: putative ABC transporter permease [Ruminococcus sp.]|jgi:uncharacterized membrane protein|nr:putative ABC transporter permease [Ruminococcus sp.]